MRRSKPADDLILVDASNRVTGYASPQASHDGRGLRHRAFSVFLFNGRGEILLQRRSRSKRLWPAFWSNSCCSHPRRGETVLGAARRRVREELGVRVSAKLLFRFEYEASYRAEGSEHEVCAVLLAQSDAPIQSNVDEVAEWRFASPADIDRSLRRTPDAYTPWMHLEWRRLRRDHWLDVRSFLNGR